MEQYIPKFALVSEIENRIKELQNLHKENEEKLDSIQKTAIFLCINECKVILSFLNSLEAKEVDLKKEVCAYMDNEMIFLSDEVGYDTLLTIAKHFFELGILCRNRYIYNENKNNMMNKKEIKNIIELFIAWNGETEAIDVANIDSAVEFIDSSLQEEPVNKDLEEAAAKYIKGNYSPWLYESMFDCYKAGAKWGKNHTMTEIQAQSISFAHGCPKEKPVSIDLENAALEYATHYDKNWSEVKDGYIAENEVEAFKAGANWQEEKDDEERVLIYKHGFEDCKEQMMKEAIDAQVLQNYDGKVIKYDETILDEKLSDCKVFDKVKLIIIKGD